MRTRTISHILPSSWLLASLWIAAAAAPASANVEAPGLDLDHYVVTSWGMKDGLPSQVIWAITQDQAGYLWLGTNGGLVRFDGVEFVTWDTVDGVALPKVPVRSLLIARDGTFWIGFSLSDTGGVGRIRDGRLRIYGPSDGLPLGTVNALVEDAEGAVWAGNNVGLFRLDADRWEPPTSLQDLPQQRIDSLYIDTRGDLLVGTGSGVFRQARHATAFERVDSPADASPSLRAFSEDRSGRIWMSDPVGGFRLLGDRRTPLRPRARGNSLLHDRDGNLWVTTMSEGIWRVTGSGAHPMAQTIEKARAPGARAIFEDRDGHIWAGNGEGLIRFAKPHVTPVTNLGLVYGVQATPDGGVWAATPDDVRRFSGSGDSTAFRLELSDPGVRAFRVDERGVLWVATSRAIVRLSHDRRAYPLPGGAHPLNRVASIASDWHGGLWILDRDRGLLTWSPKHASALEPVPALAGTSLSSIFTDSTGRLWFATATGQIGVLDPAGTVRLFGREDGLGAGLHSALYEDSRHVIWIGGNDGLTRFANGRFVHINQGNRFRTVIGIVEDGDGDLWLGTTSGLVCVTRSELDQAWRRPGYEINARVFDAADGLAGLPVNFGHPTQVRDGSGRLWFVTGRGLTAFDPRALKHLRAPTAVKIEGAAVDEVAMPVMGGIELPAGASRLAITYSVLDLATPWRTRFRYRLDGFDTQWVDAGTHREAVYTRLPPGEYHFRVGASNAEGSWNDAVAEWQFAVAPMFYQTYWFYAACVLAIGLAAGAAWQLRVRTIRRQFTLLIGERARLSREIHDTLLQGLVGVALQFDGVGAGLDPTSPARQHLVRIRKEVEQYVREARHSIWNLRKPVIGPRDLPSELREAGRRLTAGHPIAFDFAVRGTPRPCPPETEEQLVHICQEAVLNTIRHARATCVIVELRYEPRAIVLRVTDDGLGFDPATTVRLESAGHCGLVSMRERAAQVGGGFSLMSSRHEGTSIEARVPAAGEV